MEPERETREARRARIEGLWERARHARRAATLTQVWATESLLRAHKRLREASRLKATLWREA